MLLLSEYANIRAPLCWQRRLLRGYRYAYGITLPQEVMNDPCVASDGYTYDRKAIEIWVGMNDKSPMTNLLLPNKNLIPNYSLRSAIMDWKSRSQ